MKSWCVLLLTSILALSGCAPREIRPEIRALADEIAKENVLCGAAVGFAGQEPGQWRRFRRLSAAATGGELAMLTDHLNPAVRCYAFRALVERNDPGFFDVLSRHLTDDAPVTTMYGCVISESRVGDQFLLCLEPGARDEDGNPLGAGTVARLSDAQRAVIEALALYPSADTVRLFEKIVSAKDEFRRRTLSAYLWTALKRHPHAAFDRVFSRIRLDESHIREAEEAFERQGGATGAYRSFDENGVGPCVGRCVRGKFDKLRTLPVTGPV